MRKRTFGPPAISALAATILLLAAVVAVTAAADEEHPVVGRWVVEAEPGGAVWAFQPSGALIVSGPGDIISEGTWTPAQGPAEFDATVDADVSGQLLEVLGEVSDDASGIALYVTSTYATRPDDWTPWPPESRLLGHPLGMMVAETPSPTEPPRECFRPRWVEGAVDWDRCDDVASSE
mgnify:CR=1 FL=1